MADSIDVHFKSNNKDLRAVVSTDGSVKAVLILPETEDAAKASKTSSCSLTPALRWLKK
jgi:hypothetical protein